MDEELDRKYGNDEKSKEAKRRKADQFSQFMNFIHHHQANESRVAEQRRREQEQQSREQEQQARAVERQREARIHSSVHRLYSPESGISRPVHPDAFVSYLERVFGLESHLVAFQNERLTTIPSMIRLLTAVQEVNLSQNNLVVLPQDLFAMPHLKRLYVHSNAIRVLPTSFGEAAHQLEVLDLHANQITALPADFGTLTRLQSLDMEKNKLKALPEEIGNLRDTLQHLNLASNHIKILPVLMGQLRNLSYLNLKNNPIVNLPPHIYLQGPVAAMKFLRELAPTAAGITDPSSLIHDFSRLPSEKGFLADLILQSYAGSSSSSAAETREQAAHDTIHAEISNFAQELPNGGVSFQVHTSIVTNRCKALQTALDTAKSLGIRLQVHPTLGLPILPLKLSTEQLAILIIFLYSDQYHKPELPLLTVATSMSEDEVVETVKQNQLLTQQFQATLACASATASTCQLPYLQYLVDRHFKQAKAMESTFGEDVKRLWKSGEGCDASFAFPLHPEVPLLHAHKVVLCARSKFFRTMLTGGLLESQQKVVEIRDIHPRVFANMVEFCYTDDVEELDGETIMELLAAARLYGLDRLLGIVESVVGYSLDTHNVCGIMTTAALYSLSKLARACKFFVLSNWETVTKTEAWQETPLKLREKLIATATEWGVISHATGANTTSANTITSSTSAEWGVISHAGANATLANTTSTSTAAEASSSSSSSSSPS